MLSVRAFSMAAQPQLPFLPFGGFVTITKPCDEGFSLEVETAYGPMKVMWLWGELPFLMYVPPHIDQEMIGDLSPVPAICTIGGIPYDGGLPIIMHGSSL